VVARKTVLITDLDNTLFDWVDLWHSCFAAMLSQISAISGIEIDQLKPDIRHVHQRHGTSEYSFLIEELPQLRQRFPDSNLAEVFKPAIDAYRAMRREKLRLYPTVAETLLQIKGAGAAIIGYTESMAFYSNYRVRRLGLDGVFDWIFSPEDHDLPAHISSGNARNYPAAHYQFRYTRHAHTPRGSLKPDPKVLLKIIGQLEAKPDDCVYVGDSLHKDIAMARDAGVMDAYAQYGRAQHTEAYRLLREVTHWSDADVEREKRISDREICPGVTLTRNFGELRDYITFGDWNGQRS
jgi:phosphoglycolate phosphatase-like HAD superfamily hydrolase